MTRQAALQVDAEQHHTSLRVADLSAAVDFYITCLGFLHAFSWGDPPTMAGVNIGETQIFLEVGTPAPQGCSLYFVVGDADELDDFHCANGVEVIEAPGDRPWELRGYTVRDLDASGIWRPPRAT